MICDVLQGTVSIALIGYYHDTSLTWFGVMSNGRMKIMTEKSALRREQKSATITLLGEKGGHVPRKSEPVMSELAGGE